MRTHESRTSKPNEFSVLDYTVGRRSRRSRNAMRIVPNGTGAEAIFTLLRTIGMSAAVFAADATAVERDLKALKALLER